MKNPYPLSNATEDKVSGWLGRVAKFNNDEKAMYAAMDAVYREYLSSNDSIQDLAASHDIPMDVMVDWARAGKWQKRRELLRQELLNRVEVDHAEFVRKHRTEVAKGILDKVQPRLWAVLQKLEESLELGSSMDARRYAEAYKMLVDSLTKASGLDVPVPASERPKEAAESEETTKPSWFQPGAEEEVEVTIKKRRASQERPVINITGEEHEEKESSEAGSPAGDYESGAEDRGADSP